jgi:hypothetical protein
MCSEKKTARRIRRREAEIRKPQFNGDGSEGSVGGDASAAGAVAEKLGGKLVV